MNRTFKWSMLAALALGSAQAAALELGQVRVKSALGQPLLAEIPLTVANAADLRDLRAQLASAEDFAHAGIAGGRPGIALQFSIVDTGAGKLIRITSSDPVNDPYLDLLVEVDSAAGKSLREYPILLDPPESVVAPVSRTSSTTHATSRRPATSERAPAMPSHATAVRSEPTAAGQSVTVARGETLSAIARANAPAGIGVNQMMLAIKQANPEAFYRDNINALKSGAVLRMPSNQEAQAVGAVQAAAEVQRQAEAWRGNHATVAPSTLVADKATQANPTTTPVSTKASDRLALVPSKEQGGAGAGNSGGKDEKSAALRQELQRSQETLSSLQQQGDELKSRLKDLEAINDRNQRLLALKDNQIADLQQKLAAARKGGKLTQAPVEAAGMDKAATTIAQPAKTSAPPPTVVTAPATSVSAGVGTHAANMPAGSATASVATSTTHAPTPTASKARSVASRPKPAPAPMPIEETPWYMQTWAMAAAVGVVVLLLLLALLARRRKPASTSATMPASTSPAGPSLADRFGAPVPASSGSDPDQDELLDQLAGHPDDIGLHLELVSLYYDRRDVERFEAAAEAMHAHVADPRQPEWQDVLDMGRDLAPEHPLFAQAAPPTETPSPAAEPQPFDHDRPLHGEADWLRDEPAPPSSPSQPPPLPASKQKVSEYHFDFNLTPPTPPSRPSRDVNASEPAPAPHVKDEPRVDWNFDEPETASAGSTAGHDAFGDDPVDTKLDLARAYLDMGDPDGARAMLDEVLEEGSQMQKDIARKLLDSLR